MLSYVLRLNYAYKGRYLATVSSRWDGSSKFQKDNRWGGFPIHGISMAYQRRSFAKELSWISNFS